MRKSKNNPNEPALPVIHSHAAGIDIGGSEHYVCVPEGRCAESIKSFKCFTPDLHKMAQWLKDCGVQTIAMESTSVYWIPVYQILEQYSFDIILVNARHVKMVPGRKTDVKDCQWLQRLHSYGLLSGSFRPSDDICILRSLTRQRDNLIRSAAVHTQRMQKALSEMNVQLHRVISNINGVTGTRIIEAIISGEYDPSELVKHRDYRVRADNTTVIDALTGDYRREHLFVLKQEYELYKFYQAKIQECDAEIELQYQILSKKYENDKVNEPLPKRRPRNGSNRPTFDLRESLYNLTGIDFTKIPGVDDLSTQKIISEIGLNPKKWASEKHFTSWLGLCPGSKISGGKILSGKTRKVVNRAAETFRICALTAGKTKTALGAYYRKIKSRIGAPKAITATARKLACLFYRMLKFDQAYVEQGMDHYEQKYRERSINSLKKRAKDLGFKIIPDAGPEIAVS